MTKSSTSTTNGGGVWKSIALLALGVIIGAFPELMGMYKSAVTREELREEVALRSPWSYSRDKVLSDLARHDAAINLNEERYAQILDRLSNIEAALGIRRARRSSDQP